MFICTPCRNASGLHERMCKSFGRCEVCGNSATCDDWPSSQIPDNVTLKRGMMADVWDDYAEQEGRTP